MSNNNHENKLIHETCDDIIHDHHPINDLGEEDWADDDDDEDHRWEGLIRSVRTSTGLEEAVEIYWPPLSGTRPGAALDLVEKPNSTLGNSLMTTTMSPTPLLRLSTTFQEEEHMPITPMFDGTAWAGTRVWTTALVTVDYLLQLQQPPSLQSFGEHSYHEKNHHDCEPQDDDGVRYVAEEAKDPARCLIQPSTRVLELGCGLGVPGMILHAMRQCTVVLTDRPDLMGQLQRNVQTNFPQTTTTQASSDRHPVDSTTNLPISGDQNPHPRGRILVHALDWSNCEHDLDNIWTALACSNEQHPVTTEPTPSVNKNNNTSLDVVICCDCIFEPLYGLSWQDLLKCQEELLNRSPSCFMLTAVERRSHDGVDHYLQQAAQSSVIARVTRLDWPQPNPSTLSSPSSSSSIELYRLHGPIEEETA